MILAILQARFSSTRLPGKVLKTILGRPMLSLQIERVQRCKRIDQLLVATSEDVSDNGIEELCHDIKVPCFRGSLNDVLDRFYNAASLYRPEYPERPEHIVRLTGDCPLTDPLLIDQMIDFYLEGNFDYATNTIEPTFPDGLDVEIFRYKILEEAAREAILPSHREHVTPFMSSQPHRFKIGNLKNSTNLSHLRWTVDEPEDFEFVSHIYKTLYKKIPEFSTQDILNLLSQQPDLLQYNNSFIRNEGVLKSLKADEKFINQNKKG